MKRVCLSAILSLIISVITQAQSKPSVIGIIPTLPDGKKVWLIKESGANKWRDSAIVKKGRFKFRRPVEEAGVYTIRLTRDLVSGTWIDIYLDQQPITVSAKDSLLNDFVQTGSKESRDFNSMSEYLNKNVGRNERHTQVEIIERKMVTKEDTIANVSARRKLQSLNARLDSCRIVWINEHPRSIASLFLLYDNYSHNNKVLVQEVPRLAKTDNPLYVELAERVGAYQSVSIGMSAPLFTQNDPAGKPISLSSLRGKYVLLDFWASWCGPCRAENPTILAAYNKFKDRNFTVLGISFDDEKDLWLEAIQTDQMPWQQVSDLKGWGNALKKKYYIDGLPTNFLISPEGKILAKNLRGERLEKVLGEMVK